MYTSFQLYPSGAWYYIEFIRFLSYDGRESKCFPYYAPKLIYLNLLSLIILPSGKPRAIYAVSKQRDKSEDEIEEKLLICLYNYLNNLLDCYLPLTVSLESVQPTRDPACLPIDCPPLINNTLCCAVFLMILVMKESSDFINIFNKVINKWISNFNFDFK